MNNIKYELFKFEESLPLKIFIYKLGDIKSHWHESLELFYVLEGKVEIITNDQLIILNEEDFYLNNVYDAHELHSQNGVILSVEIDLNKLGLSESERENLTFDCNSSLDSDKSPFYKIKNLLAALINYNLRYQDNSKFANLSIIYSLFAELMNKFRIISNQAKAPIKKNIVRLREISKFINENYDKNISLKMLSNKFDLTVPYLSSFFEKNYNKNFQDYYDELRISKSISTLLEGNCTLQELAIKFGFTDSRGYVRAFRKIHSISPNEYKKNYKHSPANTEVVFTQFETNKYLDKLVKNNTTTTYQIPVRKHKNSVIENFAADFNNTSTIRKTYLNFFTVSRAADFLSLHHRTLIEETLKEIPFKYVKFHGIFDDAMHVVKQRGDKYTFSFVYIDMVLDYIMKLGIKPLIQLSYMPSCLAEKYNFYDNGMNISFPKNDEIFLELIKEFTNHIIQRYGKSEVESWPFTFWNAPDTTEYAYGFKDTNRFNELYKNVFLTVKNIDPKIQFGSPSLLPLAEEMIDYDKNFLNTARDNNVYPDFLIVHYYSNNFSNFFKRINKEQFPTEANTFSKFIDFIKRPDFYSGKKIYLTEFNFTSSHRNLLSDTIYSSVYTVKNIVENLDRLDSFGHWYLSDLIDDTQLPENMLHGGLGFYTINGIKKPSYYAYYFLSKLGNELIFKDEGIIITKDNNKITILLYNYEHFSNLYASGDYFELSYHNRYIPFAENKNIVFNISINNVPNGNYEITETSINKTSGSIFDCAEECGVTGVPNDDIVEQLKALSTPKFKINKGIIENNKLEISNVVSSLEIKLLEIKIN